MNEKKFDYCFCSWLIFCLALYCIFTRFKIFFVSKQETKNCLRRWQDFDEKMAPCHSTECGDREQTVKQLDIIKGGGIAQR